MDDFQSRGAALRAEAKELVFAYMRATPACRSGGEGMRLAHIFRACGFDWGEHKKATSSNQQYWVVALMRDLEAAEQVEQVSPSGPWRVR